MGNNPSSNAARPPNSSSPSHSNHESAKPSSSSARREPRNLIQGTHRSRHSQSNTSSPSHQSPSQSINNSPSLRSTDSQKSKEEPKPVQRDQPSKPVNVPTTAANNESSSLRSYSNSIEPSGPPLTQDMSYHLTRPPRLPLPIEEEVHTPGSPIIAPSDIDVPVLDVETLDDPLPRRSSALSNTTIDEEDAEELRVDKSGLTVPTTFEWVQGGEKVYVTGTIFQWNKKHRLHPDPAKPGVLTALIHVRPGTHHVRYIVDGVMQCSTNLPTTVDFGNNLVNYIEVSADDIPRDIPVSTEGTGTSVAESTPSLPSTQGETKSAEEEKEKEKEKETKPAPKSKLISPPGRYSSQIPQYLLDLDKAEDSAAYQYAAAAIERLPSAPSLPGFLGKPILNAVTPMKDDNSVLTMPNHTVLNHLATSSIKNNVLAVSATTRYKRKYVTTIMYKPTSDE